MKKIIMVVTVLFLAGTVYPHPACAEAPLQAVQSKVNSMLEILRDPELKADSKREIKKEKLWVIINDIFDFRELSRRVLGRNWRELQPDEQEEFIRLFSRLLDKIYMDRILSYSGQKIVFTRQSLISKTKADVQCLIITKSREIPVHYKMIMKHGRWRIYDVFIEGVSLVRNYRSQFNSVFRHKKPSDLLEMLRQKIAEK